MKCHLKSRDGWIKVINHDYVMGSRLVFPERNRQSVQGVTFEEAIRQNASAYVSDGYHSREFEFARSVEIRDHKKNVTTTEAWFEEL